MRRIIIASIISAAIVAVGVTLAGYATSAGPSSEAAPLRCDGPQPSAKCPTATRTATNTPTATPTLVPVATPIPLGGGKSIVLAQDVIVPPGPVVPFGTIDPLSCGHPLFYITGVTTAADSTTTAYFHILNSGSQSGEWASFSIGPSPVVLLLANFNVQGGHLFASNTGWGLIPQTLAISVLHEARFTVEALCYPAISE